ncbi:hypothetical protein [Kribbella sp. CA-293567]|uniref:hypothetical protein n=1 Tax=Kribbella sp. CA-293567 TaxID=3002436 RepID=UPI0022DDE0BB|nr:hypothetical protein [Kribbella sp. CA-293567]WBQ06478.1 hypothetical protein OX958_06715 [Kribbella sp. CA-293567]
MAFGKNGKPGKEHTTSTSKNTKGKHQAGQARAQADQQRNPNPNTRAGRNIIAKKKEGGKGK